MQTSIIWTQSCVDRPHRTLSYIQIAASLVASCLSPVSPIDSLLSSMRATPLHGRLTIRIMTLLHSTIATSYTCNMAIASAQACLEPSHIRIAQNGPGHGFNLCYQIDHDDTSNTGWRVRTRRLTNLWTTGCLDPDWHTNNLCLWSLQAVFRSFLTCCSRIHNIILIGFVNLDSKLSAYLRCIWHPFSISVQDDSSTRELTWQRSSCSALFNHTYYSVELDSSYNLPSTYGEGYDF